MINRAREVYTHEEAIQFNFEFEKLLSGYGIQFEINSPLERMSLRVLEVFERHKTQITNASPTDVRDCFVESMGLSDLTRKILRVKDHESFDQLLPHLALLNKGEFAQNSPLPYGTEVSNKVFELLIACSCMTFVENIELDHPESSSGSNPDVMVDYDGRKYGIACKALLSQNPKALYDNVTKAIDQIEVSPADAGFVVISLKNVADHVGFWEIAEPSSSEDLAQEPEICAFASPELAIHQIEKAIQTTSQTYLEHAEVEHWQELFKGKKAYPCIVFVLQTACIVSMSQQSESISAPVDVPVSTTLSVMQIRPVNEIPSCKLRFLGELNRALHNQI